MYTKLLRTIPSVLHEVSDVLVRITVGIGKDLPVVLSPELEGGLLIEIGEGGIAEKLCGSLVLSLLVDDVSVLEFDQSGLEVFIDHFHDLLELDVVGIHLDVGVEDLAAGRDGFSSRLNVSEHSGRRCNLDGSSKSGGSIPSKGKFFGLFGLVANVGVEGKSWSSGKGCRSKGAGGSDGRSEDDSAGGKLHGVFCFRSLGKEGQNIFSFELSRWKPEKGHQLLIRSQHKNNS